MCFCYVNHHFATAVKLVGNNNSLIIDKLSIPEGLLSSHFHVGCTTGWNDTVMTSDRLRLSSYCLPFKEFCGNIMGSQLGKLSEDSGCKGRLHRRNSMQGNG